MGSRLLCLPFEVRRCIFQQVLDLGQYVFVFRDSGSAVEYFSLGRRSRWVALLYVNRQVSVEARIVLYGSNQFLMEACGKERVTESFLKMIGRENAGLIRCMCMHFPEVENTEDGGARGSGGRSVLRLAQHGVCELDVLAEYCVGLRRLETLVYGSRHVPCRSLAEKIERGERAGGVEVLSEIDWRVRSIGKVNKIIVRIYGSSSSGAVFQHMVGLGWTLVFGGV